MTDPYTRRHTDQNTIKDADQVEWQAYSQGLSSLNHGLYDNRISRELEDFTTNGEIDGWSEEDVAMDSGVGKTHEELQKRIDFLGNSYPFSIENNTLIYSESKSYVYEFFLNICFAENLTTGKNVNYPRTFERITSDIVATHFGSNVRVLHVGAPRDVEVGTTFSAAMNRLHEETGEWVWKPDDNLSEEVQRGDQGVDFVVWKEFDGDLRLANLFILGQCACGNDFLEKYHDIDLELLRSWFGPMTYVTPVKSFLTPRIISTGHLHRASRAAGLVYDRLRLSKIAEIEFTDDKKSTTKTKLKDLLQDINNT